MITAKQFIKEIDEEGQEWSDDTEVLASYFEDYAKLYHETEVKKLSKANVSGQLPELFRNFIRTNHLTSKWEDYLKENEGNLH